MSEETEEVFKKLRGLYLCSECLCFHEWMSKIGKKHRRFNVLHMDVTLDELESLRLEKLPSWHFLCNEGCNRLIQAWFLNMALGVPLPIEIHRFKLTTKDPKQNHYSYIFMFGYGKATWLFDDATDYSGGGERAYAQMETLLRFIAKRYRNDPHVNIVSHTIPYETYMLLTEDLIEVWKKTYFDRGIR